ncbi:hypothetical protein WICPIJ_000816 [Wickerhamomyces pijperi]|uniref:Uncharacterized protein n=1 Tax=Wickerhamomyces pijperi TaxID=599730 RepID=A0A9P8TRG6_WICPI|nr:hypothetical protein WICPIJ_000816 [Wickerhamomyces pijperi]
MELWLILDSNSWKSETKTHVLKGIVTQDLINNDGGTGISHGESFTNNTTKESLTTCGTEQVHVTSNDVFIRLELGVRWRSQDQLTTTQPLPDIIVSVTFQVQSDTRSQLFAVANHLIDRSVTQLSHELSQIVDQVVEEVDHVFWRTFELLSQDWVLSGDTDRTRVQVALSHHDTTHRDQWDSGKGEAFGTQENSHSQVEGGSQLTVGLKNQVPSQVVQNQRLLSFTKTQFPSGTSVQDRRDWRSTSATVMTRDQDVISLGLSNTTGNDPDTQFGHQLDRDPGSWIGALQVVNQLFQIFNGVNVMMLRRRDKLDVWIGTPGLGDFLGDFLNVGDFTTLTRLSTLGNLDLQLVTVGKVVRRDTESGRGNLLDTRLHIFCVAREQSVRITTFTTVGLGVHLLLGVSFKSVDVFVTDSLLQRRDDGRIIGVLGPTVSPMPGTGFRQDVWLDGFSGRVPQLVQSEGVLSQVFKRDTLDSRGRAFETHIDDGVVDTQGFKDLGTFVRVQSGDTHLSHDLVDTSVDGRDIVLDELFIGQVLVTDQPFFVDSHDRLHGEVWVNGIDTVTQ